MYFTIVQKPRLWEKFGSSVKAKMLTANLIIVNYDHQYLWKIYDMEIIITGIQHLRPPLLVWWGQLCLQSKEIAEFFDHGYLERIKVYLSILHVLVIKGRKHLRLPLLVGVGSCASHAFRLHYSLIINICGKNQVISQFFAWSQSLPEDSI